MGFQHIHQGVARHDATGMFGQREEKRELVAGHRADFTDRFIRQRAARGARTGIRIELFFPTENVEFVGAVPKTFEHRNESGRWLRLQFCGQCGTTVGMTAERRPTQQALMGGTFDDHSWFTINRHIQAKEKVGWVSIPADVPSS